MNYDGSVFDCLVLRTDITYNDGRYDNNCVHIQLSKEVVDRYDELKASVYGGAFTSEFDELAKVTRD